MSNGTFGLLSAGMAMLLPALVGAQTPPTEPPVAPSLLLPNYNRVLIGEKEALEGGAFVARADGAVATFYNPAGLGLSTESKVTAGLSTQEWMQYSASTGASTTARTSYRTLGGVFGVVIGPEVAGRDKWRFAFLVMRPVSLQPALELRAERQTGTATQAATYVTTGSVSDFVPAIAAAYNFRPTLRFGGSVRVSDYTLYQNQTLFIDDIGTASLRTSDSLLFSDGGVWSLIFTGGVQWDALPRLRVGAHVTLPSIRMFGSSSIIYRGAVVGGGGGLLDTFADDHARVEYRQPFAVSAGVAYLFERGAIEFDVKQYAGTGSYSLFASDQPFERTIITAAGTTYESVPFPANPYTTEAVTNIAVGGSYRLSSAFTAHGGFYTDRSPVTPGPATVFSRMNLMGVTAGTALHVKRVIGSVGIAYLTGESELVLRLPAGAVQPTVRVSSIQLFYALSVAF